MLAFICLLTISVNLSSQTRPSGIDSVGNLLNGNWNKTQECGGLLGGCQSVNSNYLTVFERIVGTDSIIMKIVEDEKIISSNKYKIAFIKSFLYGIDKWMLISSFSTSMIIDVTSDSLSLELDAIDGTSDIYSKIKSTAGMDNLVNENSIMCFYPNPANDFLYYSGNTPPVLIKVYKLDGVLIEQTKILPINISDLNRGIYFLQAFYQNNKFINCKIIKN